MSGEDYFAWREKMERHGLMRHLSLGTQSSPLEARRHGLRRTTKVVFVRYDMSPIETSSTRHGGATLHIRNPEGPSRSPNHSSYVRMTLSATKVAAS
ncbi:hypothetical protein AAG906_017094 [Vitis piasezkii]